VRFSVLKPRHALANEPGRVSGKVEGTSQRALSRRVVAPGDVAAPGSEARSDGIDRGMNRGPFVRRKRGRQREKVAAG